MTASCSNFVGRVVQVLRGLDRCEMVKFPLTQSSWLERHPFPSFPLACLPTREQAVGGAPESSLPSSGPDFSDRRGCGCGHCPAQRCDHPARPQAGVSSQAGAQRAFACDVAPGPFLGCWPEPAPLPHPSDISGQPPRPALSPAQLMPACPAPAFWPSGPASSLDLRHGLGGAEGGGEQMPTAPCPPLNNRTAEARLAVSPESQG